MEINEILEFYRDKSNYTIKNGVVPVMIDGGDLARSYKAPEPLKIAAPVTTKTIQPKKRGRPKKNKSLDDEELSYLPKYRSDRREENTSMDLVTTKCRRCSNPTTARKFEVNNEFGSVLCKNCLKIK